MSDVVIWNVMLNCRIFEEEQKIQKSAVLVVTAYDGDRVLARALLALQ